MSQPRPQGIYPMLYAFFGDDGALDRGAMRRQIEACVASGAHGVAVLGLATEVAKLTSRERYLLVDWVAQDLGGRLPLAVTVFGSTVEEQIALARHARANGAAWVILQPPRIDEAEDSELMPFLGAVMDGIDMPVAVQNAPQYLGIGLTLSGVAQLAREHANFTILKGEGPALLIRRVIELTAGALAVFNGRAGLELTDNLRAGCAGVIPAIDFVDRQARVFDRMRAGREDEAEALYREILPGIVFVMQSIEHLICYGKRLAAIRLGIGSVHDRLPALAPEPFGLACAQRYARALGPLPG
ncbi:MAG TPA: dihydrodipicolinate synthase family protein [Burkholderiales bacterium]|nr:dihydrodipicolinate synthase family protein [Burkholderiales bacterium]